MCLLVEQIYVSKIFHVFKIPIAESAHIWSITAVPHSACSLGEELGSGQFGTVVKGKWHKVTKREEERGKEDDTEKQHDEDDKEGRDKEEVTEVAVKMLKEGSGSMRMIKFLREAAIMGQFSHPNVVTLHGVATEGEPVSHS